MGNLTEILEDLTQYLEDYRNLKAEENLEKKTVYKLTKQEEKDAVSFLSAPNLMEKTNDLIGKSGVIGEVNNRLLMFLVFTSRKQNNPLHIISLGKSGTGKSHLQEKIAQLIPQEDKLEVTVLSENAFYYFQREELKHKLILIEDMEGVSSALYPIRELQSKKHITKTVVQKDKNGNPRTKQLVVEGPICVAGCSTQERIYQDNANRSFIIQIDQSKKQDNLVMEHQRGLSSGSIDQSNELITRNLIQNTQRVLKPIRVINPFAFELELPKEVFKPRRTNAHYLNFIEVVTFYHQFQRTQLVNKETGEVYIETTLEDIEIANQIIKEALLTKSDELSNGCRNFFENLKEYLKEKGDLTFFSNPVRKKFRMSPTTLKRYLIQLLQFGLIKVASGDKHKGYEYKIESVSEYNQLKNSISKLLDETLLSLSKKVKK